jgi:ERCC4-related helicase
MKTFSHKFLKSNTLEDRQYQSNISKACLDQSTLVILPTGMGKTVIALRIILERITKGQILLMAPTKPLAQQHSDFFKQYLDADVTLFTGAISPEKRKPLWKSAQIIVSTPQVVSKDIENGRVNLGNFSLVIFDEAHRAVGNYAYVAIGNHYFYVAKNHLAIGMTASPGSSKSEIIKLCRGLGISAVENRDDTDPDVVAYIQPIKTRWLKVEMPDSVKYVANQLRNLQDYLCGKLYKQGFLERPRKISTTMLLKAGKHLQVKYMQTKPQTPPQIFNLMTTQAMAMKIAHAILTVETQGLVQFVDYAERIEKDAKTKKKGSRANKWLSSNSDWKVALQVAKSNKQDNPKLDRLSELIDIQIQTGSSRFIVFAEIRHTASIIVEALEKIPDAKPVRFVGQGSREGDKGMTQKQQKEILNRFRDCEFNILVATSVGEEGLDIPSTDVVIFYEPVSSAIRLIQRRGRTGRNRPGEVFIFVTEGSRDEAALWSSRGKEQRMQDLFSAGRIEIDLPNSEELALLKSSETLEIETGQTTFDVE